MMRKFSLSIAFMLFVLPLYALEKDSNSTRLTRCKPHELEALLKFKHSFSDDPENRLSSWDGDDCCHWLGVTCDNVTGNVVKLNLRGMPHFRPDVYYNEHGKVDVRCEFNIAKALASSEISPALRELKFLYHLDLSFIDFRWSRIPEFLGSMRNLRYLNLSSAHLSGPITPQLGNLTNLIHLDLKGTCDTNYQQRYAESLGWASGFTKLKSLDMSRWKLSNAHDTFRVLTRLPSLLTLSLQDCQIESNQLSQTTIMNTSTTLFSSLQYLDLSENYLETPLPSIFKNMISLQYLDLSMNNLETPLLSFLNNMISLQYLVNLDLSYNGFEGPLPPILKNIVSLKSLRLMHNNLNGAIPLWLRKLRLEVLDLRANKFSYVEGGLWGFTMDPCSFKYLDLSENAILQGDLLRSSVNSSKCAAYDLEHLSLPRIGINGTLPSWLGQLTNLKHLDLSNNELEGQVPASLANLSALTHLDLSKNRFTGLIPDFFWQLVEILFLDISSNFLQGTVSDISSLSKLIVLNMSFNSLNLDTIFNWNPPFQLRIFNARFCKINTAFPRWFRNQTELQALDLSYTGIYGELPEWLWNMTNLHWLQLSDNQLTGSLLGHIGSDASKLYLLDLHNNLLNGSLPHWFSDLDALIIDLSYNFLSGAIFEGENASSLLSGRNMLNVLNLNDNMFFGEMQLRDVQVPNFLEILNLGGNSFTGPISSQLCQFLSLGVLDLARNRLTGTIPRCLGSLQFDSHDLDFLNLDSSLYRVFRGIVIEENVKGTIEVFNGTKGIQSVMDLSSNQLVGTIPEELTKLSQLIELNLSHNHLTGSIPKDIGNLLMLESIDLSNNNLSGTIPQSLSAISGLGFLNFSNNNLHGPIPMENHLQTLINPSNCAGNPGLCGFPLPNQCTNLVSQTTPEDDVEDKREKMWFYLVIMSGVATGFWGVVGTLVVKKSWRHAYFRFVEETGDRIYVPIKVRLNRLRNKQS